MFADPGWLQPGCDHAILIVGLVSHFKAGAGPRDQLCHIVMDPAWGTGDTTARAAARTMVQECRVIKQMVTNHPVQLQVVESCHTTPPELLPG